MRLSLRGETIFSKAHVFSFAVVPVALARVLTKVDQSIDSLPLAINL